MATQETTVEAPTSPLLSPVELGKLEQQIKGRPNQQELVERNILKDPSIAPALQAARDKLQRSQLEDKLDSTLQARPTAEELVKRGILTEDEAPGTD